MFDSQNIAKFIHNYLYPLLIVLLPFYPDIYQWFQEDKTNYIYSYEYKKNPVIEWNRQIDSFLKNLTEEQQHSEAVSNFLLKKIGKEFADSLPVILAVNGHKPMDSMEVKIYNLSSYDLKNISVHFSGCVGYDSYKTYPDAYGAPVDPPKPGEYRDNITIKYDSIPRSMGNGIYFAYVTFYGVDASGCKPAVTATNKDGFSIRGKLVDDVDAYRTEMSWQDRQRDILFNFIFKIVTGLIFCYFYIQIRNLRKRFPKP